MKKLSVPTINEVLTVAIRNKDLDEYQLDQLKEMEWYELCGYLELGDALYMAANEETVYSCLESIIEDEIGMIQENRIDRRMQERDRELASEIPEMGNFLSNGWEF